MGYIKALLYQSLFIAIVLQTIDAVRSQTTGKDLSKSILHFTSDFTHCHANPDVVGRGNLVWSPLSLYQAMLMVGEGADGETLEEFERITHLKNKKKYQQWSSHFLSDTNDHLEENRRQNISLNIANRLYADKTFDLNKKYNQQLRKSYHSELQLINFNKPKDAAKEINQWISKQTNNIIKDILKATDINSLTRLMLVNALYFKAPWLKAFHQKLSSKKNFTSSFGNVIQLPTMHLTAHFSYYHDKAKKSQWINLPYKGHRYVLTLALPDEGIELRQLEGYLKNSKVLSGIFRQLDDQKNGNIHVNLSLPKFRIKSSLDFVQHFKNYYNVTLPFDANEADFSPMSANGERGLFISKVIHKAVIVVDEAGTEAAAVTAVQIESRSGTPSYKQPIHLAFSRPFLFYLRDIHLQIPLFVGRFTGISYF